MQETRYKIIRIDEEDYGCEERPDDYVPMVSVLVKAIEPDDFGDFPLWRFSGKNYNDGR